MLSKQQLKNLKLELIEVLESYDGEEKIKINTEALEKLDFTGIFFDDFKVQNIDFTDFTGVELKITGSLDRCHCSNVDFTGSIGGTMFKAHYFQLEENNNLTDVKVIDEYGELSDAIDMAFQKVKK